MMLTFKSFLLSASLFAFVGCATTTPEQKSTQASEKLSREADSTLATLYGESASAKALASQAAAVLVFSNVVKAGFLGGADFGKGVLKKKGKTAGYYNLFAASVGFQAGVQSYDYVLIFMKQSALDALNSMEGFQVGIGPSIVVMDAGAAQSLTTSSANADVYAYIFDQKGIMGAINLEGSKITQFTP